MGAYWLKQRKTMAEMERELDLLRMKVLRLKLDINVLCLTPNSRRAAKIRDEHVLRATTPGHKREYLIALPESLRATSDLSYSPSDSAVFFR